MYLSRDIFPLTSERLTIRPYETADKGRLHVHFMDIAHDMLKLEKPKSLEQEARLMLSKRIDQGEYGPHWWVGVYYSGMYAGDLAVTAADAQTGTYEIGYYLMLGFRGAGIMTEAVDTVAGALKTQKHVKALTATVAPNNPKSVDVLKRCGFRPTTGGYNSLMLRFARPIA